MHVNGRKIQSSNKDSDSEEEVSICWVRDLQCEPNIKVFWSTSELNGDPLCYWYFMFGFVMLSCLCDHLLGNGWPFDCLLCCVSLCFCHFPMWCSGSGVVLDCIDYWSLPPSLLWTIDFLRIRMSNPKFRVLSILVASTSKKISCTVCFFINMVAWIGDEIRSRKSRFFILSSRNLYKHGTKTNSTDADETPHSLALDQSSLNAYEIFY